LYNGGSEWQNDYSNLPDYYQTFNRNYDAAIGRFVGVDPMAESAESMTTYNYSGNNPIMFNDPAGNKARLHDNSINLPVDDPDMDAAMSGGNTGGTPLGFGGIPIFSQNYMGVPGATYTTVYNAGGEDNGPAVGSVQDAINVIYRMTGQVLGQNYGYSVFRSIGITNGQVVYNVPYYGDHNVYRAVFASNSSDPGMLDAGVDISENEANLLLGTTNIGGSGSQQESQGDALWNTISSFFSNHFYYEAGLHVTQGGVGISVSKFQGVELNWQKKVIANLSTSSDHHASLTGDNGDRLSGGKLILPLEEIPLGIEVNVNQNNEFEESIGIGPIGFEHTAKGNFFGIDVTQGFGAYVIGLDIVGKFGLKW